MICLILEHQLQLLPILTITNLKQINSKLHIKCHRINNNNSNSQSYNSSRQCKILTQIIVTTSLMASIKTKIPILTISKPNKHNISSRISNSSK
jgi:hypothetical protein